MSGEAGTVTISVESYRALYALALHACIDAGVGNGSALLVSAANRAADGDDILAAAMGRK